MYSLVSQYNTDIAGPPVDNEIYAGPAANTRSGHGTYLQKTIDLLYVPDPCWNELVFVSGM